MSYNQNLVTLLGYYGSDERVCLAAWNSTHQELGIDLNNVVLFERLDKLFQETVRTKKKSPKELLEFLGKYGHETPFEKSLLDFQVTGDIASHIHLLKHRIGVSINSESARYKELQDKHYMPEDFIGVHFKYRERENQIFSVVDEIADYLGLSTPLYWSDALETFSLFSEELYHTATKQLTPLLGRKRAKESARYFLTYNKQLVFDTTFNLRSFAHFVKLRATEDAQVEIRELAQSMLWQVYDLGVFEHSLNALGLKKYL